MYGHLGNLRQRMSEAGATRLVAKRLAPNDNSKNQIYLGSDFEALNILPFGDISEDRSAKNAILKAPLKFCWLLPDGSRVKAPHAQLILYPQYPEVRMSGFLRAAQNAPREIMTTRLAGRILFLGIDNEANILAAIIPPSDELALEFEKAVRGDGDRIFFDIGLGGTVDDKRDELLAALRRISNLGWIDSKRLLTNGRFIGCDAPNCGGCTLEAELGIRPNSYARPDYLGWEIKQHGVRNLVNPTGGGPITLMTPEPNAGYYKVMGVEAFLRKYGYVDRHGRPDRINFGGIHKVGVRASTGLTLILDGYDIQSGKLLDPTKGITLLDSKGDVAAVWGYAGLIKHWAEKHDRAAYLPSIMRRGPRRQYRYAHSVLLGQKTDFFFFLKAMETGQVYYDPGIKLENASTPQAKTKSRSQFRVKLRDVPRLYSVSERVSL